MDPYRWRKLSAIFNSAMSHPPEERSAFLRRACVDDSELRAEIESLIADDTVTFQIGNHCDAVTMPLADYRRIADAEIAHFGRHL